MPGTVSGSQSKLLNKYRQSLTVIVLLSPPNVHRRPLTLAAKDVFWGNQKRKMICTLFIPMAEHNFLGSNKLHLKKCYMSRKKWRHKKEMPMKVICPSWVLNMIGVQVGARTVNKAASEVLFLEPGEARKK